MIHWAKEHDSCVRCGTTDRPHKGLGLCTTCYYKQYKRPVPAVRTDGAERAREEMFYAVLGMYGKARVSCPLQYRAGKLTLKIGGLVQTHEF